jgi:hypothetical protein
MAEAPGVFADQHRVWGERQVMDDEGPRRMRYNLAESPVAVLGRRRDKDGKPFPGAPLVEAAERLREDFELAQMGPRVAQNWEKFLTGGDRGAFAPMAAWPRGRRAPANGWRRRCATWARPGRCGAAGVLLSGRHRGAERAWAGRRGRARSCCASR